MEKKEYSFNLGDKKIDLTFSNWVEQANASVLIRCGDTVVLTTAVMSGSDKDMPYFPLMVEYREKYYAAGFIGGGRFLKREARPSDESTLRARLIDRSLRPLFNQGIRRDIQIVNTILSYDETNSPDVLALIASSTAVFQSDIPWNGPLGAVRIGKIGDEWVVNPSNEEQEKSRFNVLFAGTEEKINMIEVDAKEVDEKEVIEAMKFGHDLIKAQIDIQNKIRKEIGKEKQEVALFELDESAKKEVKEYAEEKIKKAIYLKDAKEGGHELGDAENEVKEWIKEKYEEKPENIGRAIEYLDTLTDELVHEAVLRDERRVDGRKLDEIRSLSADVSVLPRTHGSAMFMRGLTHALSVATLDSPGEEELSDVMEGESKKRFMHHYNFPPYSVGETGFFRGPGRREIGHGSLAEKALEPLIPPKEEFPYVVRVVSEVLSSNGSSSMASVCGSSLALMDAGVPIKKHIAGIAMGLITGDSGEAKVLTDIQGPEDHYGDMDFKVAGTRDGVTAIQMDVKIEGASIELLEEALEHAKKARFKILDTLEAAIPKHKENISPHAPAIKMMQIDPERIGMLIGAGGRTIKELMAETGTDVSVEDDGSVFITGKNKESIEKAANLAYNLTREIKIGEEFDAKVTKIADFGAFVELVPGHEALVHISELKDGFVKNVEEVVKTGDRIKVKVTKIDDNGKIGASAKQASGTDKASAE